MRCRSRCWFLTLTQGPSGSGKTALLTLLSGLRTTSDDSIRLFDCEICGADRHELVKRRRRIGYIFQHHNLVEFLTAGRNVELMFELHPMVDSSEARKLSDQMLTAVGLQRHLDSYPRGMSGGQRQRVAIARALVTSPDLILTDEPTDSLDKTTGRQAVELLESLSRRKSIPMLMVTHDNRILDIADRIVRIEDGRLLEDC